jgi:hypothetical protein
VLTPVMCNWPKITHCASVVLFPEIVTSPWISVKDSCALFLSRIRSP